MLHAWLGLQVHDGVLAPDQIGEALDDLAVLRRVRDRIDREYAQPLDVEALGWEAGGTLALPMLIGQIFLSGLFLYGFAEGWRFFFPHHPEEIVAFGALVVVLGAATFARAHLYRAHLVALVIIAISLIAIVVGLSRPDESVAFFRPQLWGPFSDYGFWLLFAVLFPAAAAVGIGISLSDDLADPGESVPRGGLAAVGTAFVLYVLIAIWHSVVASPFELRSDVLSIVRHAIWGEVVVAALLTASLVGAMTLLISAARTLRALVEQRILPVPRAILDRAGTRTDPFALAATAVLIAAVLLLSDLNRIALATTLFYLTFFLALDAVLVMDQLLDAAAFRPRLRVPLVIPGIGFAASLIALLMVSPVFAVLACVALCLVYAMLIRHPGGDREGVARSGMGGLVSDGLARYMVRRPALESERGWRPDLLVPVESRQQLDGTYRFLRLLAEPGGSLSIIGVRPRKGITPRVRRPTSGLADRDLFATRDPDAPDSDAGPQEVEQDLKLNLATDMFRRMGLEATSTVIEAPSLVEGVETSAAVLRGTRIRPGLLFGLAHLYDEERLFGVRRVAMRNDMGLALLYLDEEAGFGYERTLNVWVSDRAPEWKLGPALANLDLALLLALQVCQNWKGNLRLCTAVHDPREEAGAEAYLKRLARDARLGTQTEVWTTEGRFMQHLTEAPRADLQVVGLPDDADLSFLRTIVRLTRSSCLFVRSSGRERILA